MDGIQLISSTLLWLFVLGNLVLTLSVIRRLNTLKSNNEDVPEPVMLQTGDQAPDFVAETTDGDRVSLKNYLGFNTVFIFVSPDCNPCREEAPKLDKVSQAAERVGVKFVFVSLSDRISTQNFADELNLSTPIVAAPRGTNDMNRLYKATATPSFCYFDNHGVIVASGILGPKWHALQTEWQGQV